MHLVDVLADMLIVEVVVLLVTGVASYMWGLRNWHSGAVHVTHYVGTGVSILGMWCACRRPCIHQDCILIHSLHAIPVPLFPMGIPMTWKWTLILFIAAIGTQALAWTFPVGIWRPCWWWLIPSFSFLFIAEGSWWSLLYLIKASFSYCRRWWMRQSTLRLTFPFKWMLFSWLWKLHDERYIPTLNEFRK